MSLTRTVLPTILLHELVQLKRAVARMWYIQTDLLTTGLAPGTFTVGSRAVGYVATQVILLVYKHGLHASLKDVGSMLRND
jgi:hypothetical protein